jgi:hypothetical protein
MPYSRGFCSERQRGLLKNTAMTEEQHRKSEKSTKSYQLCSTQLPVFKSDFLYFGNGGTLECT